MSFGKSVTCVILAQMQWQRYSGRELHPGHLQVQEGISWPKPWLHLRLQERIGPDSHRVHAWQQERQVQATQNDPRTDSVEIYHHGSLVNSTSDIWQATVPCHGTDTTYYVVLNAVEVQIPIGYVLHISTQIMCRHGKDNEGIDIGCSVR